jgi:Trypsin-co-occurring domain 1
MLVCGSAVEGGTMAYQLGVRLDDTSDNIVMFEVDEQDTPNDLQMASDDGNKTVATASVTLDQTMTRLKPQLHKLVGMLKELAPDEASVDFGLKIGGEYGAIIAKGTAEVNFVIHMAWKTS